MLAGCKVTTNNEEIKQRKRRKRSDQMTKQEREQSMLVHTAFTAYKTRIAIVLKIGNLWVPEAELLANRCRSAR
jgi:hypothetical protein